MHTREIAVGSVPCRALRVTYVGELGWELYCPSEYGAPALGHALGRQGGSTASSRADTRRSTRSGWRRAIGCGARTSRPRTRPSRPGSGFAVKLDKGDFVGREALARAPSSPSASSAASRSRTREPSRSARSRFASETSSSVA